MKSKPAAKSKKTQPTVHVKDLKPRKDPKAGMIATDGDPDGTLIP